VPRCRSIHMENRLLPLKQTVRHPLDPRTSFHIRTPEAGEASRAGACMAFLSSSGRSPAADCCALLVPSGKG